MDPSNTAGNLPPPHPNDRNKVSRYGGKGEPGQTGKVDDASEKTEEKTTPEVSVGCSEQRRLPEDLPYGPRKACLRKIHELTFMVSIMAVLLLMHY